MARNRTQTTRKGSRWGRFGLLSIFTLFVLSGVLRVGGLNMAEASTNGASLPVPSMQDHETADQCVDVAPLETALGLVTGRAETLDAREAHLNSRAEALDEAEANIAMQLAILEETEARLESLLALSDTAAESDLSRLTQVYETMDAGDAAALFSEMDPSFAAGFLGRMSPESAAGILAELEPGLAYSFSVLLASRNASAASMDGMSQN